MRADRSSRPWALSLVVAFIAPTLGTAHEASSSRYTYLKHVRPLLDRHCAACHRVAGVAPMSLLRYEAALPWVNAIKLRVLERRMPPWLPEEGALAWRGARGLTAPELDLLVEWASGGAPRGEGLEDGPEAATPKAPEPPADLVLTAARETVLAADESERTECISFPARLPQDRSLSGMALRPGNPKVVRRAVVYHGEVCGEEDRPLATWLPGEGTFLVPEGAAETLRRGASLSVRIFYKKTWGLEGQTVRDRSRLALRFGKTPGAALAHVHLRGGTGTTFERPVRLVAVFPRGVREAALRLQAKRPGQGPEPVLAIERFDPLWSAKYVLERPFPLPAGTRLEAVLGDYWIDYLEDAAPLKVAPRRRAAPGGSP